MLGSLMISAFLYVLKTSKNSQSRSIDEIVYYRMAKQIVHQGFSGYNSIPYGRELAETGRVLPQYFFEPLFKHPPLFTLLIAFSMKLFRSHTAFCGICHSFVCSFNNPSYLFSRQSPF